ncbi:hypothetical protein K2Z83_22780 [Oscillochloris sp. ZM17-4]|uniref:hypothetical protein n=1 Tax=Oscillochloris sp. ZM17-4 TaxID=2866714 RepID=UPI001C73C822|nr:hypothetical protein [Oscillochloris sp. ZM17-4]MBX0330484.1 hypothetical protein [Oscillochloris sp. ZM17-4]
MSVLPPRTRSRPAAGQFEVPLEPFAFAHLLQNRPDLGASILINLSPRNIQAQATAHAALDERTSPIEVLTGWQRIINTYYPTAIGPDVVCGCVIDPQTLAEADIDTARMLVGALSPRQRVQQAITQAAILAEIGYPTSAEEILRSWECAASEAPDATA